MAAGPRSIVITHVITVPFQLNYFRGQPRYMVRRGFQLNFVCSPGPGLQEFGEQEGVCTYGVSMQRRITPYQDIRSALPLYSIYRSTRTTIAHGHTPKAGLLAMMSAAAARVPIRIYHVHGLPMLTARRAKQFILSTADRIACFLANQVLCVSHSVRQLVVDAGLCSARKIKVLGRGSINGVDLERFHAARFTEDDRHAVRNRFGIPEDAIVYGFVGRLSVDKGLRELHHAWLQVRQRDPRIHLLVIGPKDERDCIPEDTYTAMSQDPRIHLGDSLIDPVPAYLAMDVVALPSYREGLSGVLLEGGAMGKPAIATNVPGCFDVVEDGVTGILIPSHDAGALAAAMERYVEDPVLRRRHGNAARQRVARDFNQHEVCERLCQEYCDLLAQRSLPLPFTIPASGS